MNFIPDLSNCDKVQATDPISISLSTKMSATTNSMTETTGSGGPQEASLVDMGMAANGGRWTHEGK